MEVGWCCEKWGLEGGRTSELVLGFSCPLLYDTDLSLSATLSGGFRFARAEGTRWPTAVAG